MTEPTDADRKAAAELIWGNRPGRDQVEAVARALAGEREKARAPFLALAEVAVDGSAWSGQSVATAIHRAAQTTP